MTRASGWLVEIFSLLALPSGLCRYRSMSGRKLSTVGATRIRYPVAQLPKIEKIRVEPLGTDEVVTLGDAVDDRYRALVVLAAGTGTRQVRCSGRRSLVRGLMTVSRPVGGEMARTNSRAGRSCQNAL